MLGTGEGQAEGDNASLRVTGAALAGVRGLGASDARVWVASKHLQLGPPGMPMRTFTP